MRVNGVAGGSRYAADVSTPAGRFIPDRVKGVESFPRPGGPMQEKLTIVPIGWREACRFIDSLHRHHKAPRGQKFAIGVLDESGTMRGVATCGRPISRHLDNGLTLEVNRTCTDGFPNANSALYGACARIAAAMGYETIVTDIQDGESGTSLKAAGWQAELFREPRKNWKESSVKLHSIRSESSPGNVARQRWKKQLASYR